MSIPRALTKRSRVEMDLKERGVPNVLLLGRYNYTEARPALEGHAHAGAVEICYLVKGRQSYRVAGQTYTLSGGDIFVSFPNELHSTGGSPEEKGVLYWMVIRMPAHGAGFLGLPRDQGDALSKALLNLNPRHFAGSLKIKDHLDAITALYHSPASPLNTTAIANHTVALLLEVTACAGRARNRASGRLQNILNYIAANLAEPLPAKVLAARAGLSVARFNAWFKREAGIPPGEYVLRVKVDAAARRLAESSDSVTSIAFDLGFSSSQYFATVFKRLTLRTPSAYRRSLALSTGHRANRRTLGW